MACANELVSIESLKKVLESDLSLYRDVFQWGSLILSGFGRTVPEATLIETYYDWLGKFPVSKETRAVAMFFLGFSREFPKDVTLFDAPILILRQDERRLDLDSATPFLGEAVGLKEHDLTRLTKIDVRTFKLVDFVLPWFKENKTLEQICVLSYLTGQSLYISQVKGVH